MLGLMQQTRIWELTPEKLTELELEVTNEETVGVLEVG